MNLGHHRPRSTERRSGETGETLVELMVAVLIMGSAIVAILGGVVTMISVSGQHKGSVRSSNSAIAVVELIENAPYVNCAGDGAYAAAYTGSAYTAPAGYTVTVSKPLYLADRTSATPTFQATCPATDQGVQQIKVTVKASSGGGGVAERVTLSKRRPT